MPEVFISYSHADNRSNPEITHEVTEVIEHFLAVYNHVRHATKEEGPDDLFFLDRAGIPAGSSISDSVRAAIDECSIMLAFYSPRYFTSYHCLEEWKEFKRRQTLEADEGGDRVAKILIPIEVRPVNPGKIDQIDERSNEWVEEIATSRGLKRAISSEVLLDKDTTRLAVKLRELDELIQAHVLRRRGSTEGRRSASNVLAVKAKIEKDSLKTAAIQAELQGQSARLKYDKLDPVCVIYAGGTVGMVHQESSDILHADYVMAAGVDEIVRHMRQRLFAMPFNMHFFSLRTPIDSSNITASNWVNLAQLISEQMANYQGFVILHGTNTLAYTASALSFLLENILTKPVVLTGSEVPISIQNTDAIHNVENAIRAAAWQAYNGPMLVAEVCAYWNNHLYRGNRTTKKYASDRTEGFHTPNVPIPLATLANERLYVDNSQLLVRRPDSSVAALPLNRRVVDISNVRVGIIFIHPDMDFSDLEAKYPSELDGLILLSYGAGSVPEDPRFIATIKRLINVGTIVCNVTQCHYGRVELKLFETSATLFDLGVVDGYDMTMEAAYTKLLWAIARRGRGRQRGVRESVKQAFQRNIAGEMSTSIYDAAFGSSADFFSGGAQQALTSDVRRFDQIVNRYDIAEAFIRLEGVRLPEGVTRATVRINFGRAPEPKSGVADETLLAEFNKRLTDTEKEQGFFDKNLEVTHPFRKWFNNEEFQISVGLDHGGEIKFSSLRLVLYSRAARHM